MADPGKSEILSDLITKFCDNLQPWQDDIVLLADFQDDFEQWTLEDFRTAKRSALIRLRRTLRARGVWVESDSKKRLLPESLMDVLGQEEDDTFTWTEEEIEKLLRTGEKVISSRINNWLRKRQVAIQPPPVKRPNSPSPSAAHPPVKRPNSPSPSEASPSIGLAMKKEDSPVEQPAEKPVQQPPQVIEGVRDAEKPVQQPPQVIEGVREYLPNSPSPSEASPSLADEPAMKKESSPVEQPAEKPVQQPPQNYTDEMKYGSDSDSELQECPECRIACSDPPQELSALPSTRRFPSCGGRRRKRCFVCEKENCWSTNHSETEQNQSKDRFKNRFSSQFNGRTDRPTFEKQGMG